MSSTLPPAGVVAVVKKDCPTCVLVAPVLAELAEKTELTVYCQDDPGFPPDMPVVDDRSLAISWHHHIEIVPTLLRVAEGREVERALGWHRGEWEELTGVSPLGSELPEFRVGCGSRTGDPGVAEELRLRFAGSKLASRVVELGSQEDDAEAMFERGWTDGLPVVPPTERRVRAMLAGTARNPDEVIAMVPPDLVECTVEKVAINAVMAGCKPDYLPVVLAAVEAACTDEFNMHGLLATTMGTGPVIVVNGPIRRAIGMNSAGNVLGQGNRANSTIGRALQLVVRNVGGGRPGEIDRATFGSPGKLTFCFAEDEDGSPWEPLSVSLGAEPGTSTVTLFPGEGTRNIYDQLSREPESLARSYAANLRTMHHPKLVQRFDCLLVVGPEHAKVFADASWNRARLVGRIHELLQISGDELVRGAGGIAEGLPEKMANSTVAKLRDGGLLIVHCGGTAGRFSVMIAGWLNGPQGSQPVVTEIRP